jgi:hypothetical protein
MYLHRSNYPNRYPFDFHVYLHDTAIPENSHSTNTVAIVGVAILFFFLVGLAWLIRWKKTRPHHFDRVPTKVSAGPDRASQTVPRSSALRLHTGP